MKLFLSCSKKYRKHLFISILAVFLNVIAEMLLPTIMSNVIDVGIQKLNLNYIISYGLLMFALSAVAMLLGLVNVYSSSIASQGFAFELRKRLFAHIQKFSFSNMDNFSVSSLITRLTSDVNTLQMTFLTVIRLLLRAPATLLFTFCMMATIDFKMSLIVLAAIPILAALLYFVASVTMPKFLKMQNMVDKMNTTVQENLTNVRLIKSFVREDFQQLKFDDVANNLMSSTISAFTLVMLVFPSMIMILNITRLIIWWLGGNKYIAGNLQIGELSAFIVYIFNILFSVMMLSMVFLYIVRSRASLHRVQEVLNEKIDITDDDDNKVSHSPINTVDSLSFVNVNFKYHADDKNFILKNISFDVRRGQTIAIIGPTSSGKSSLLHLIPRFFNTSSGNILINGQNINLYPLNTLRNAIGFVSQKNVLFAGSISDNIRVGNPNADENSIIDACKAAQAHDFIMSMPMKYDTQLEQMAVNISGGQKQRLCIARAIAKSPQILILDDSTSAVDATTEAKIYQSFDKQLKNSIRIIVTQRISSIKNADKIIVLDDGQIVGQGTHQELLRDCQIYKQIYQSQLHSIKEGD